MLEAQAEKRKLGKVTVWGFVLRGFLVVDTPTSQQFQDFTLEFGVGRTLLVSWEGEPLEWVPSFPFEIK